MITPSTLSLSNSLKKFHPVTTTFRNRKESHGTTTEYLQLLAIVSDSVFGTIYEIHIKKESFWNT